MVDTGGETVWKTVALILVTVLLTGTPGIVYALRTWTLNSRTDLIQTRQDDVRDRLARLEVKYELLLQQVQAQQEEIHQLQTGKAAP